MEMKTCRLAGHYSGDNENYRTREEAAQWKEKNPIKRLGGVLTECFGCTVQEQAFSSLKKPVLRIGAPNVPVPFAPILEKAYVPSAAQVTDAVRFLMK